MTFMSLISYSRRLADLAAADPDRPVVTCGAEVLTRVELERRANRFARDLLARGVGVGDFVTVALPNSVDWFVAHAACWKIGAVPQQVSARLPARELREILDLAGSKVVIGVDAATPVAVIGLPDQDKGNAIHAIVEADPSDVSAGELMTFAADRMVAYKLPRTVEFVDVPLRDQAGKMRRSALRDARLASLGRV